MFSFVEGSYVSYNLVGKAIKTNIMETSLNADFFDHFGLF